MAKAKKKNYGLAKPKPSAITVGQVSAIASGRGFDMFAVGSDQKLYRWDYRLGEWLCHWEQPEERKEREKQEKTAKQRAEFEKKLAEQNQ